MAQQPGAVAVPGPLSSDHLEDESSLIAEIQPEEVREPPLLHAELVDPARDIEVVTRRVEQQI